MKVYGWQTLRHMLKCMKSHRLMKDSPPLIPLSLRLVALLMITSCLSSCSSIVGLVETILTLPFDIIDAVLP